MNYIKPTYQIKNVDTKELLFKYDFRRYREERLIHKFPVYKYKNKPLIYGEFIIFDDETNIMHINAIDQNGNLYSYNKEEYGKSKIIELVNEGINQEINKFIEGGIIVNE